ncbi:MAG: flavonol synthase [Flavobacteriales bacterium]|nr:flavonol synthase [Flavobacteriales bacterium]|tara:strand:+ start:14532 stop:15497 length:966 start_codon:yes stop_codon:yes gene_type:complete
MQMPLVDSIPSLDLSDFLGSNIEKKTQFVHDLGKAFESIGFVAISNHGYHSDRQEALYHSIRTFYELPEHVKEKYDGSHTAGQRGYTGKGKEHAAGRNVGDLKEFYHIGKAIEGSDSSHYQKNIFPDEVPAFKIETLNAYQTLESIGKQMLAAIALYLGLEENHFESRVNRGISILRPLHYFPIEHADQIPADAVRAAEHGDINLITLLMGASAEGLQVKRRDGQWIPITAVKDCLVVNVGDMLQRYTNGRLKSTIHRVVNPPKEKMTFSRYSVPFFMHANPDMDLSCLTTCITDECPKQFDDITAEQFLVQRLKEIGLIK